MKTHSRETFLILDGNALLHRAWHALPPLMTKQGLMVNAVYGFAVVIEKMREMFKPDAMAVAWDVVGKTVRHEQYASYKATRKKKEQELYDQIPLIQQLLEAYRIPSVFLERYEADDVIGTLANEAKKQNWQTLIVTGDLDALQLVDETTTVVFFQKGISETKRYDVAAVQDRYQLSPKQLVDFKALRGDVSDNIPGIAGIGEKTATQLIQRFGSLERIFKALDKGELEEKVAKKFRGQEEHAFQSRVLVKIITNLPLHFDFSAAKTRTPDLERLLPLFQTFEFRTLAKKYPFKDQTSGVPSKKSRSSRVILAQDEFMTKLTSWKSVPVALLVVEQLEDLFGTKKLVVAVTNGEESLVFPDFKIREKQELFAFLNQSELLIVHDLKKFMHQTDWHFSCPVFDLMIASYLLHSGSRSHDLLSLMPEIPIVVVHEKDFDAIGRAATQFFQLWHQFEKELTETQMKSVFEEIEMPLVPLLYEMEVAGILVDVKKIQASSQQVDLRIQTLEKEIIGLAGVSFNIHSPLQLSEVLFQTLKLPTRQIKKTKSGYSTAQSELEKLWDEHKIIASIVEFRELTKLKSSYLDPLPHLVREDARVHTTFHQTIAATGRLSSTEPNLQNIPIKTEMGRTIRKAFVAKRGSRLLSADYSQIELRLIAVMAKDRPFIEAFHEGADIHVRTAAEVWGVPEAQVSPEQRRAAKALNFGIIYGMGARSLARSTNLSFSEAKDFIDRYFDIHHAIREFMDQTKERCRELGYVETLFGRRRYLPEIHSTVQQVVSQAERMAINMPVQGTEADIVKMAMLAVHSWIKQSRSKARMLLQVHDELVFEVEQADVDVVARALKELMEGVAHFEVPLVVEIEIGKNWGEMNEWKPI